MKPAKKCPMKCALNVKRVRRLARTSNLQKLTRRKARSAHAGSKIKKKSQNNAGHLPPPKGVEVKRQKVNNETKLRSALANYGVRKAANGEENERKTCKANGKEKIRNDADEYLFLNNEKQSRRQHNS